MLEITGLKKVFNRGTVNEKVALNGLNITVNDGDFVTVIGGNGAGKSTMLNAICGVFPVDEGKIVLDGNDITALPEYKRAKFLGRVFQDPMMGTSPNMEIQENLALAYRRGKSRLLRPGITKAEKELYREHLKRLGLGLEDRMTSKVGLLSGGQRQSLTLLMATLNRPDLLLLDEHTAALDPKTAAKVLALTEEITSEEKLTTIMITHNMKDAIHYGNRLVMMHEGRVVYDVSGEEKSALTVEDLLKKFEQTAGMVNDLDPYTEYIPEEGMQDFELLTTGKYGGIGSLIRQKEDYVRIAQPYEGSPADKAGLKIGDKILSIDGKDAKGFTTEQVSTRLKGEPGSKVRVTVEHLDGTQQTATIRRERIAIPGVPYVGWAADGIGYIRHSDFTEGCYEEMRAAVERLRREGDLKGLILDYRSNGGGIMQEAVKILGMFVPKGTEVLSTKGRSEDSKQTFRTDSEPILPDLPLAVLVNGNSASAAEIVAGALQDLDRAVLIGQRSFGKGLVQATRPLGYNTMLKLTTAKYYIPSGRCIQAIDYSHSQEGSVRVIPDSLISEFSTKAGRKVYDGGGVMPDIRTDPEYISRFAMTLYTLGFIEDFGDEYMRRNPGREIDVRTFSITDRDYADFAEFMKGKKVPYESDTRRALKVLKKAAEDDRFAELKNKFEQVEAELKDDTQTNLETYRKQVVEAINNDIVMRYGYQAGVIEHSLPGDKEVKQAIGVLENPEEYARITREQDTQRK